MSVLMPHGVQPTLLLCKDKEHCRTISYKEKRMCGSCVMFKMELLRKFSALIYSWSHPILFEIATRFIFFLLFKDRREYFDWKLYNNICLQNSLFSNRIFIMPCYKHKNEKKIRKSCLIFCVLKNIIIIWKLQIEFRFYKI